MQIRITAPIVQHGNVQLLRGRKLNVPDTLGHALVARGDAIVIPLENGLRQRPQEVAIVPRPVGKPKGKR